MTISKQDNNLSPQAPVPEEFIRAARTGDLPALQAAIEAGVNVNGTHRSWGDAYTTTALHTASLHGQVEAVKLLIAAGANVNAIDDDRWVKSTPLHQAALTGAPDVVRALLAAGADPNAINEHGETPAHVAREQGHKDVATLLRGDVLGEQGASEAERLPAGVTPGQPESLSPAARAGGTEPVTFAFLHGAAVGDVTTLQRCLDDGMDVNGAGHVDSAGYPTTALHEAALHGQVEAVKLLIAAGANVNAVTHPSWKSTPLHQAAVSGSGEVARLLLNAGAKPAVKDAHGETPVEAAQRRGHHGVAELLRQGVSKQAGAVVSSPMAQTTWAGPGFDRGR